MALTDAQRYRLERILDECFHNIAAWRPDLAPEAPDRTRRLVSGAVPDCMVTVGPRAVSRTIA
jgi:hypothetical protein